MSGELMERLKCAAAIFAVFLLFGSIGIGVAAMALQAYQYIEVGNYYGALPWLMGSMVVSSAVILRICL